jgi:hypothetical protein
MVISQELVLPSSEPTLSSTTGDVRTVDSEVNDIFSTASSQSDNESTVSQSNSNDTSVSGVTAEHSDTDTQTVPTPVSSNADVSQHSTTENQSLSTIYFSPESDTSNSSEAATATTVAESTEGNQSATSLPVTSMLSDVTSTAENLNEVSATNGGPLLNAWNATTVSEDSVNVNGEQLICIANRIMQNTQIFSQVLESTLNFMSYMFINRYRVDSCHGNRRSDVISCSRRSGSGKFQ